jgi:hypothetical protein
MTSLTSDSIAQGYTNERVAEIDARGTTRKVQVLNPAALAYYLTSLRSFWWRCSIVQTTLDLRATVYAACDNLSENDRFLNIPEREVAVRRLLC